jgi:hypothetical protein
MAVRKLSYNGFRRSAKKLKADSAVGKRGNLAANRFSTCLIRAYRCPGSS